MAETQRPRLARSPWSVVEIFVIFLIASCVGEFMGALMGQGGQLGLAVAELAIGLALAWPVFTGRRFGRWLMGGYLVYYGLATFWLLLEGGAATIIWLYHIPLAFFFAAGGLKLLVTPIAAPGQDDSDES